MENLGRFQKAIYSCKPSMVDAESAGLLQRRSPQQQLWHGDAEFFATRTAPGSDKAQSAVGAPSTVALFCRFFHLWSTVDLHVSTSICNYIRFFRTWYHITQSTSICNYMWFFRNWYHITQSTSICIFAVFLPGTISLNLQVYMYLRFFCNW